MKALLLALGLAGCARLNVMTAVESRPWPTTAPETALIQVVKTANGYLLGTVEKAEPVLVYDDVCGITASVLGQCDGTRAHRLSVRAEDTHESIWLYVFVPAKDTLVLPVGTRAVFVWRKEWVRRLHECGERVRRGLPAACESDHLPVVPSRDHVAQPADLTLVTALFTNRSRL